MRLHFQHPSFCERYFSIFTFCWGALLQLDFFREIRQGIFYSRFDSVMPGWAWGALMMALALGRFIAFRKRSETWRLRLSAITCSLFSVIAAIALLARLWAAIFPLTAFIAAMAWWCHGHLAGELAAERAFAEKVK